MNAASLLTAAGLPSARLSDALPGLDLDRVTVRAAPQWLGGVWGRQIAAMALPRLILIRRDVLESDPAGLGELIVHELVHVHQWLRLGLVGFLWRYLRDYLAGRLRGWSHHRAYRAISLESQARDLTAAILAS